MKFSTIAKGAEKLPDCILDGENCALDHHGAPDFAALQAALSDGKSEALIFFAFDLLFADGADLRSLPLSARKAHLTELLETANSNPHLRFVEHFTSDGEAVLQSACRMNLEGIVSKRLDAPYTAGCRGGGTKSKCRAGHEVVIGGWSSTEGKFRSLLVGVHRGGHLALYRQECAETGARHPLVEAGTGGRDRIRRPDRRWHGAPGRVQGPAH